MSRVASGAVNWLHRVGRTGSRTLAVWECHFLSSRNHWDWKSSIFESLKVHQILTSKFYDHFAHNYPQMINRTHGFQDRPDGEAAWASEAWWPTLLDPKIRRGEGLCSILFETWIDILDIRGKAWNLKHPIFREKKNIWNVEALDDDLEITSFSEVWNLPVLLSGFFWPRRWHNSSKGSLWRARCGLGEWFPRIRER